MGVALFVGAAGLGSGVVAQEVAGDDVALDKVEFPEDCAFKLGLAGFEGAEAFVEAVHAPTEALMAAEHQSCEGDVDGEDGDHLGVVGKSWQVPGRRS